LTDKIDLELTIHLTRDLGDPQTVTVARPVCGTYYQQRDDPHLLNCIGWTRWAAVTCGRCKRTIAYHYARLGYTNV